MEYVSNYMGMNNGEQRKQGPFGDNEGGRSSSCGGGGYDYFQMPLHYPRYTRADYEGMPEWMLDRLLRQYGLPVFGDVDDKRRFAIGAFVWS